MSRIRLSNDWLKFLSDELAKPYVAELERFLESEYRSEKIIYPSEENIFRALELVPPEKVKVVILGQDPYHGENEAHGLSFSVRADVKIPPSLNNIFKELKTDCNVEPPPDGDLTRWASQGVLLLNSVLTVEKDKAGSHRNRGWEKLTDKVISVISENCEAVVFVLWGAYAQEKTGLINQEKHLILQSPHPSPLSSYRGYFGSRPFSKANEWLKSRNKKEINW
jgi:uracil-DNA glycosylase